MDAAFVWTEAWDSCGNCPELFPFFEANSSLKILKTLDDAVRDFHSAPKAGLDAGACHANPREDNCSERGP